MQFFTFNLENFTPHRIFYTGAACGACDKYEVWFTRISRFIRITIFTGITSFTSFTRIAKVTRFTRIIRFNRITCITRFTIFNPILLGGGQICPPSFFLTIVSAKLFKCRIIFFWNLKYQIRTQNCHFHQQNHYIKQKHQIWLCAR